MNSGRSTFLSGLILGAVLGLAMGHFTLWSHFFKREFTAFPTSEAPYFQGEFLSDSDGKTASLPPEFMTFLENEEHPTSNLQLTAPFENAIAFETEAPSEQKEPIVKNDRSVKQIPFDPTETEEPQPLSIPEAQPLKSHTLKSEEQIRELIEMELPNAPASQKEVWFESLKDLKSEDVSGVLKMWKMFGGPVASAAAMPNLILPDSPVAESDFQSGIQKVIEQAIQQHRQNILMHSVPGYKRTVPVFVETQVAGKTTPSELSLRIDFQRGTACKTDHPFDLMIVESTGMFCVKSASGETFYTSCGRFGLSDKHQLCLKINHQEYILQPEITVTTLDSFHDFAGATNQLQRTQEVAIIDHNDLISAGNGLFIACETANIFTKSESVLTGYYEASNIDLKQEQFAIQALEQLAETTSK